MSFEATDGDPVLAAVIRDHLEAIKARGQAEAIQDCPRCNPNAQAIQYVSNKWIEAGINRGE